MGKSIPEVPKLTNEMLELFILRSLGPCIRSLHMACNVWLLNLYCPLCLNEMFNQKFLENMQVSHENYPSVCATAIDHHSAKLNRWQTGNAYLCKHGTPQCNKAINNNWICNRKRSSKLEQRLVFSQTASPPNNLSWTYWSTYRCRN